MTLATVAVVTRAGQVATPPAPEWRTVDVPVPRLDVSSTEVRLRVAEGRPVDGLVPAAALRVLRERGLYIGGG